MFTAALPHSAFAHGWAEVLPVMFVVTSEATDAQVIAASCGDPATFAVLYDRYEGQLYAYAYRRVVREVARAI